ncbi:MAG: tRNA pseudouridine(13) synthase TruD, partial [Candidatus Micrarchaeota archaeon]
MFQFQPEEFIVEEITEAGDVLELDKPFQKPDEELRDRNHYFSRFVLQKRMWTSNNAIRQVAERLHINAKRINFAGNKDRNAFTTQMCSAFAVEPVRIRSLNIKDIKILGTWLSNEKAKMGGLAGNRFTITLTGKNIGEKEFKGLSAKKIIAKMEKGDFTIANYFGEQRFGSARRNTAEVGKLLLQGKFKEAVLNYLCFTDENERDEGARASRKRLAKEMDFREALHYYPHFLKTEKLMLSHLVHSPNDFLGAFRRLHRSLQLLFIHAYQSELFNKILAEREKKKKLGKAAVGGHYCRMNAVGFPDDENPLEIKDKKEAKAVEKLIGKGEAVLLGNLIGYSSKITKEEESLLKKEKMKKEVF